MADVNRFQITISCNSCDRSNTPTVGYLNLTRKVWLFINSFAILGLGRVRIAGVVGEVQPPSSFPDLASSPSALHHGGSVEPPPNTFCTCSTAPTNKCRKFKCRLTLIWMFQHLLLIFPVTNGPHCCSVSEFIQILGIWASQSVFAASVRQYRGLHQN